ncbi:Beta-galactosidase [Pleurostoma richardsiae]|uniref:Beta-galactosidase n=1 Tax=Pleurostoma richardsiae TaxID=41990 RepID=A0AA38RP50_9PEZI|nr:Beta-galactosidase [Pleurostoma richardsiae]
MKLLDGVVLASLALRGCSALTMGGRPHALIRGGPEKRALLQDVVTFDEYSLFINGERLMIFSGEFHPFRLPVPSLWLDVFQKIKALGLNTVSFYVHWGSVEGKPGNFTAEGVFDLEPFFEAAKEAGIYLTARPGPYINAEATGGGFPGWLQRVKGKLRTSAPDYLAATDNYMANIGSIIAKAQITNGGPVILVQPENEYTYAYDTLFPDPAYMQYVEDQLRNAGIVVPLISNDAYAAGHNAPGTGEGEVDIYGHDGYPLGFDCANPYTWPANYLSTTYRANHLAQSPTTPYSLVEFQGGSFDPPGGLGFDKCAILLNNEFERVFYKNNFAAGVTIFSVYMIFGGTNWGNIGHPGGYTSYDYGASISEDRTIDREKYSELKLEAQFLKVSPGYLTAVPGNLSASLYASSPDISVTPVIGTNGSFFIVRHTDYASLSSTSYTLSLPTSAGNLTIPQLGGSLSLNGRDSKVHVTDYPVGDATVLYSTAEIFTWKDFGDKKVLIVYGGPNELHEIAFKTSALGKVVEGSGVTTKVTNSTVIAQWQTTTDRRILHVGDLFVYILDRNSAYDYWVPDLPTGSSPSSLIIKGPYLVRSISIDGAVLNVKADFNSTAAIEVIGVPEGVSELQINGQAVSHKTGSLGSWIAGVSYTEPSFSIPDLAALDWAYIDSLPEIKAGYDDSAWPDANHTTSNNTYVPLETPVSLYGSDYGFNTGSLLLRGHFTSVSGAETSVRLWTEGGQAFGFSAWLNDTFLGSWAGIDAAEDNNTTFTLPNLKAGAAHVLTVLIDNMGLDENGVGYETMKSPRGILDYALTSPNGTVTPLTWKITGNLGGEDYADRVRGPLNEGGLFVERMGYHQPSPPVNDTGLFATGTSPYEGIPSAGVAYYTAELPLDLPSDAYDVPLSFVFTNDTEAAGGAYRALLFVNGWQFGRYTSNVGPQTAFPVPEGVLDYKGTNWLGLVVWALEAGGAKVPGLELVAGRPVLTGREKVVVVNSPAWSAREGAY